MVLTHNIKLSVANYSYQFIEVGSERIHLSHPSLALHLIILCSLKLAE